MSTWFVCYYNSTAVNQDYQMWWTSINHVLCLYICTYDRSTKWFTTIPGNHTKPPQVMVNQPFFWIFSCDQIIWMSLVNKEICTWKCIHMAMVQNRGTPANAPMVSYDLSPYLYVWSNIHIDMYQIACSEQEGGGEGYRFGLQQPDQHKFLRINSPKQPGRSNNDKPTQLNNSNGWLRFPFTGMAAGQSHMTQSGKSPWHQCNHFTQCAAAPKCLNWLASDHHSQLKWWTLVYQWNCEGLWLWLISKKLNSESTAW